MLKILLIEDNDVDARLTQDILAEWNLEEFSVTHVGRLSDAFGYLARARFDAVLLDLSLPDGYGLSTVRQIHAANPTIALIVLSGLNDQPLALQAVKNGAQDYLVKGKGRLNCWPVQSIMLLNGSARKNDSRISPSTIN